MSYARSTIGLSARQGCFPSETRRTRHPANQEDAAMSGETMTDITGQSVDREAFLVAPLNEPSRARLADNGLEARLVPPSDAAKFASWLQVAARGFLDGERSEEQVAATRERSGYRRTTGIYDPSA